MRPLSPGTIMADEFSGEVVALGAAVAGRFSLTA